MNICVTPVQKTWTTNLKFPSLDRLGILSNLPCSFFSVSQNFCNSVKYLSSMKTFDRPNVAIVVEHLCGHDYDDQDGDFLIWIIPYTGSHRHRYTRKWPEEQVFVFVFVFRFSFSAQALAGTVSISMPYRPNPKPSPNKYIYIRMLRAGYTRICLGERLCSCNKWSNRTAHENK